MPAGSAVAWDGHGHLGTFGWLPFGKQKQGPWNVAAGMAGSIRGFLGATDAIGDGAIAVARKGSGSVIGVSLGRPSPADAENRAMEKCVKGGGINPKIICGFKG